MPTTAERGYGSEHEAERARWKPIVEAGHATCWRCQRPIHPDEPWDLGHDDHDRTITRGPEHRHRTRHCPGNRSAGATKGNRTRARRRTRHDNTTSTGTPSRNW